MTKLNTSQILNKYEDIIKEEINIKEIWQLSSDIKITKTFKPLWSKLSNKFGKDTGKIIQLGKEWNIKELSEDQIMIFDNDWNQRTLQQDEYEIAYEGINWDNMSVDWDIIARLDLEITPQLLKEWITREISRFLNQMRKDADYQVDTKVSMYYNTDHQDLQDIIIEFENFLKQEALIKDINKKSDPSWDIKALFTYDEKTIEITLQK